MGNTPGKQGMNTKRKRGGPASKGRQETSPPTVQKKRSKTKVKDDDVLFVSEAKMTDSKKDKQSSKSRSDAKGTPSNSNVSTGPSSSSIPKAGPLKIKAMSGVSKSVGRPKRDSSVSETKRSRSSRKEEPLPPLIPVKSGPRAEVNECDFKVHAIMKKWVGKSDQALHDEFYLVHWAGRPASKSSDDDSWLHRSQLKDCDDMIKVADEEFERIKEERKKRPKKSYYAIVSDSEDERDKKKKKEEEVKGFDSAGKVLRIRNSNLNFNEDGKDVRNSAPRRTAAIKKEPIGFDRGLPFEKIVSVANYNGRLTYLIKFEGSTKCDLVPSSICRKAIPYKLIDFLTPNIVGIEEIKEAHLSAESRQLIRRAQKLSTKIAKLNTVS